MKATEILALVKEKLVEQGCQSCIPDPDQITAAVCAYNGENGTHCGIGWLQPGGDFTEGIAVVSWGGDPNENTAKLRDWGIISQAQFNNEEFRAFLIRVQKAHDQADERAFKETVTEILDALLPYAKKLDKEI